MRGMAMQPDAIVVDAGSTDAGPHKLGAGVSIVSRTAAKMDIAVMVEQGLIHNIPVIIGSAGGAGAKVHVEWTLDILREMLTEQQRTARVAVIYADIGGDDIRCAMREQRLAPLGNTVPPLTEQTLETTHSIVAQMGHEPIVEALKQGADIIICGRAYDPSPFAAVGILAGFDAGLCYHLGKILECGALCAEPGTTKDCILGTVYTDSFTVQALNPIRRCTKMSVAAHTFYEKENPVHLNGPGFTLDLSGCSFAEEEGGIVRVRGSRYIPRIPYRIKLEGAHEVCYRTFVIAAVRDPLLIAQLQETEDAVTHSVQDYYAQIPKERYKIRFTNYGLNGVMGELEPDKTLPHEVCVLMEALADTQELASMICASVRSTFLHYGYPGRKSTSGNLAFPFAPSDVDFGKVYAFSVYHLMDVPSGVAMFPTEWRQMP